MKLDVESSMPVPQSRPFYRGDVAASSSNFSFEILSVPAAVFAFLSSSSASTTTRLTLQSDIAAEESELLTFLSLV